MVKQILLFAFLAVASASIIRDGSCPGINAVKDFDVTAYTGVWYEIFSYPSSDEYGECAQAEYTLDGSTVIVKNSEVYNGIQIIAQGTAVSADENDTAANLIVTFSFGGVPTDANLSIVATDYNNYAIAYNCVDLEDGTHTAGVWILSRSKTLEGEAEDTVNAFLTSYPAEFDYDLLEGNDLTEESCTYSSTFYITS